MTTNLDALLTALYVHLDDHVLPSREQPSRRGPAPLPTDAELVCVAIAQVLLRCDDERRWLRLAPGRIGHLFPRLPCQSEYNRHLRTLAPALLTAAFWPARATPGWWDLCCQYTWSDAGVPCPRTRCALWECPRQRGSPAAARAAGLRECGRRSGQGRTPALKLDR